MTTRARHREGTTWVLLLAALPFAAKGAVLALGATGYALQSLYKLLQLAVPAAWRRRAGATGVRMVWPIEEPLPARATWLLGVAIAVGLAAAAVGAGAIVLPALDVDPIAIRAALDERFRFSPATAVAVVLFLSTLNAGLEELHFRAWLDRELSARLGDAAGIAIASLAFGAMHVLIFLGAPGMPILALVLAPIPLAIAGACWSLLARRPGGIHAAWLSHGLTDVLLLGAGLAWLGYLG